MWTGRRCGGGLPWAGGPARGASGSGPLAPPAGPPGHAGAGPAGRHRGAAPHRTRRAGTSPRSQAAQFPNLTALAGRFAAVDPDERFELLLGIFVDGLAQHAAAR